MLANRKAVLEKLNERGYNPAVEKIREEEFPQLRDVTYLDHAGTTLYAASTIREFSADMLANLYGNTHSPSPSGQLTARKLDDIRLKVLQQFHADPEEFDIVFCANATAGIKLVVDALREEEGFRLRYHGDAHTSLIGMREMAKEAECLLDDAAVERWMESKDDKETGLFAWPAQSNLSGRRLGYHSWCRRLRTGRERWYSLLDAASFLTSTPLDLSDAAAAPDFVVMSFYKTFGFPDLGGLIVRRDSAEILRRRKFFGGGTVDSLTATKTDFVAKKDDGPHSYLEDGTLPLHSIIALGCAIDVHQRLFGGYERTSKHVYSLGKLAHEILSSIKHGNGRNLCFMYSKAYDSVDTQGPIIAFNLQRSNGSWIGYAEFEKLCAVRNIHVRVGGMCNPGGIEALVGLKAWEIQQNYAAGHKCSDDNDIMNGKPTGAIRISFGASSTVDDILAFVHFLEEFYVDKQVPDPQGVVGMAGLRKQDAVVESLTIYPIKSCGGFSIPKGMRWDVLPHGLSWDREWCLVHLGTGAAINQKQYNSMALIRPTIDLASGYLRVIAHHKPQLGCLEIPLYSAPADEDSKYSTSRVCGDKIKATVYTGLEIIAWFTEVVGVSCSLARFPADTSTRNFKPHLAKEAKSAPAPRSKDQPKILLSNESPILVINAASVDALNTSIAATNGKPASSAVFRANITIRPSNPTSEFPEDHWTSLQIGDASYDMLGACRRCHMICIDQETAERDQEPFSTLSKIRRGADGRVYFGAHAACREGAATVMVGERVVCWSDVQEEVAAPMEALAEKTAVVEEKALLVREEKKRPAGTKRMKSRGLIRLASRYWPTSLTASS